VLPWHERSRQPKSSTKKKTTLSRECFDAKHERLNAYRKIRHRIILRENFNLAVILHNQHTVAIVKTAQWQEAKGCYSKESSAGFRKNIKHKT
jgi:hypothetical protein